MPADNPVAIVPFPPVGAHVYVYGAIAPVAVTVAAPVAEQAALEIDVFILKGEIAEQELFIELIQAAFAALFGNPGVSEPEVDTFAFVQLAGFVYELLAELSIYITFPPWSGVK